MEALGACSCIRIWSFFPGGRTRPGIRTSGSSDPTASILRRGRPSLPAPAAPPQVAPERSRCGARQSCCSPSGRQRGGTSASLRQRGARLGAQAEGLLLAGGSLKRGECPPAESYQHQDLRGRCQEPEVLLGGEGLPDVIPP